jgi:hypothetical protein
MGAHRVLDLLLRAERPKLDFIGIRTDTFPLRTDCRFVLWQAVRMLYYFQLTLTQLFYCQQNGFPSNWMCNYLAMPFYQLLRDQIQSCPQNLTFQLWPKELCCDFSILKLIPFHLHIDTLLSHLKTLNFSSVHQASQTTSNKTSVFCLIFQN